MSQHSLSSFCIPQLQSEEEATPLGPHVVASVPRGSTKGEFNLEDFVAKRDLRTQGVDFIAFALAATQEALQDAQLDTPGALDPTRSGVCIGSGIGSISDTVEVAQLLAPGGGGPRRVSPFFVPRMLVNMAAGAVSMRHSLRGPNCSPASACATGAHAIGDASRMIALGDADVMLAGGTEGCIAPIALAGFSRARALSTAHSATPSTASRPFGAGRDGFVLGEGAAVLVLEDLESAVTRGAKVYAEVGGYGMSGDAFHITLPREDGSGAALAMGAALRHSGLTAADVGYVNAHATSTPQGDVIEAKGIAAWYNQHSGEQSSRYGPLVSSTKGATGHLLGAAGAVEAAVAVLALHHRTAPGTAPLQACGLDEAVKEAGAPANLNFVTEATPLPDSARATMSNSFGFGGTNAALLFKQVE